MKRVLLIVLLGALLFAVACGGAVSADSTPSATEINEFNLNKYKELVIAYKDNIMDESILLSNMGTHEYNFWKALNKAGFMRLILGRKMNTLFL